MLQNCATERKHKSLKKNKAETNHFCDFSYLYESDCYFFLAFLYSRSVVKLLYLSCIMIYGVYIFIVLNILDKSL